MAMHGNLNPQKLKEEEIDILRYVLKNSKASQVASTLLSDGKLYFNELHEKIGGNRTTLAIVLSELEEMSVVTGKWEVKLIKAEGGPKSRAVRSYELTNTYRDLITGYQRLILPA